MESSGTMVMMVRQHGDRWSSFGGHSGIEDLSTLLRPDQLKQIEVLQEFDDDFLREISPDLTIAKWKAGATIFEEGAYLDIAFFLVAGKVEMFLTGGAPQAAKAAKQTNDIVFLASADYDLAMGAKIDLEPGEMFGEIGAMNGWPQSTTARTATACTLLQIRLPALRKLRRKSKKLKQRLDELYRARTLRSHLMNTALLKGADKEVIEELAKRVSLVSYEPGEVVACEGHPVEHLLLVRSGSLKLTQRLGVGEIVVSYISKGSTVGESELLVDMDSTWQATSTSVGNSELVQIAKADFADVIARFPDLEQRLWDIATKRIKDIGTTKNNLQRSDVLEFTLAKGITQANSVLVLDLDKCTRCDDCVRGCASTHGGVPRFVREGEVYDGFMVVRSCYHCQDPMCLVGCPTGAIKRINVGDVVEINSDVCIGCGACAENCPFDSIVMHDTGAMWAENAMPRHLRGTPRAVASKCDLCRTAPEGPACVSSCPHGAASRVSGAEEFDVLLTAKRRVTTR